MDLRDNMDKPNLLKQLGKATDRAANLAIQRGFPVPLNKNDTLVGNFIVEKNKYGLYDILKSKNILYKNISVLDIAVIIAQRCNLGEISSVDRILRLEEQFSKYHNDMVNYLYCMKIVKKTDYQRLAILEDKFRMAELLAKNIKEKIAVFKRMK